MNNFEQMLEKYAELVIKVGVNIQPGQVLIVQAPLETVEFTRLVVAKAYDAGAKYVQVEWDDERITRLRYEKAPDDSFGYYPKWQADMMEQLAEGGGAVLHIKVPDPELFRGIDSWKVSTAVKAAAVAREKYQSYVRNNQVSWSLIKAPTRAWADKVFADLPEESRIQAMWDAVFLMNRVGSDDPVAAWREHIAELKTRQQFMNTKRYKSLHYRAPGTDLRVELPEGHLWLGGGDENEAGVYFVANMPTEEIYTMPLRTGVNGTVTSTMPLNLNGRLVEGLRFTFKDGKVTDYDAVSGREHLTSLLETDEGAAYLGEVALVPHDSPISRLNRIFYNTGIDENASCHFALGSSYPVNIEGGTKLSKDELLAKGANVSLTHVDFMIGSAELDIDGELADGTVEPVFRQGRWV
ncbi:MULTISPECIES: aminopeptidase [Paenibacillus]|uniref:Aminopeptidase n=1 Tax=Paenibacillus campinasensis TaxID=66347 RepID=A0A268EU28_9BACL|nr:MULTISPECIES: aminopeptidase [Paenibacillus]MUG67453.1 aminopeptidase [Paenibacillus campinasensis]PAD76629.1 aminopeptidase [Paenibacillus campinasensis]PAK55588.1 aminopeptidase [Paenibacillus sp. 7541]